MPAAPTVVYPLTLPGLLHHVLHTQSAQVPTTLIVCSSREVFLNDLLQALQQQGVPVDTGLDQLIAPTLHNLFTARHVKVAFCPSAQALLAYFTAYNRESIERLVLVNPLGLHASSPSLSAQGLSRTFAVAAETAVRVGAELLVVECQELRHEDQYNGQEEGNYAETDVQNPWEQDVSILNVSARRLGAGLGDRAWAGRTIKVQRIAGRWFRFRNLQQGSGGG